MENSELLLATIDTLLKLKEQRKTQADNAPKEPLPVNNSQPETPKGDGSPTDSTPVQREETPKTPQHTFSWRDEAKIAYTPVASGPTPEGQAGASSGGTQTTYSWPAGGRFERRFAGTGGPVFRTPTYRNYASNYTSKPVTPKEDAPSSDAQPSQTAGRGSGFRAPNSFYSANQV